jgi:hypothetical protein
MSVLSEVNSVSGFARSFQSIQTSELSLCRPCTWCMMPCERSQRNRLKRLRNCWSCILLKFTTRCRFTTSSRMKNTRLGKHRIWVCRSISCMLRGGEEVLEKVCNKFHVHPGQTSADGKVTLEFAECLGACEGAPCILVDDECHMDMNAESVAALIEKL